MSIAKLYQQRLAGLLAVAILALISHLIVSLPLFTAMGISPLIIAILLGIILGNTWTLPPSFAPGIQFAAKRLLRIAIILYGFRISFQEIASVGLKAFVIDMIVVCVTLMLGYMVGRKWLKLDRDLALLVSAGAAICGAAAVLAVEEILKSEPYKAAVAIGTVVLFGTLSMFLYPLLQHSGVLGFSHAQYGLFTGASIHEVAQAVVAGSHVSVAAGKVAVIVKMVRVLLLVPVLFVLAILFNRSSTHKTDKKTKISIPWFAIGFVLVIGFHSLVSLPSSVINSLIQCDLILLTMAMGAIGLETKFSKIKQVGMPPLYLASILFLWLVGSVYVMVKLT